MNDNRKVLNKMLDQLDDEFILIHCLNEVSEHYANEVHYKKYPMPIKKENYVGIEVECFSDLEEGEVLALILFYDLEKHVNMADDGSIDADDGEQTYEFRILATEKELPSVLKRLKEFFFHGQFKVNDSCGLHVHLDMRNRDVEKCYKKLIKFQDVLFGLVEADRWDSEYCQWSDPSYTKYERFSAINFNAYSAHKTLEVRLHHGTLDTVKIGNWVKLLLKAIKGKELAPIKTKKDVLKLAGKDKKLKSYLKDYNIVWFRDRKDVILNMKDNMDNNRDYDEDEDF